MFYVGRCSLSRCSSGSSAACRDPSRRRRSRPLLAVGLPLRDPVRRLHRRSTRCPTRCAAAARLARRARTGSFGHEPRRPRRRRRRRRSRSLFVPRRYALVLPALVLVYFAVSQHPIVDGAPLPRRRSIFRRHHDGRTATGSTAPSRGTRTWRFCGPARSSEFDGLGERVLQPLASATIYTTGPAVPGGSRADAGLDRQRTGYVRGPDGRRVLVSHVLTDATGEVGGTVVGEDGVKRLVLYRVRRPAAAGGIRRRALPGGHVVGEARRRTRATRAPGARWSSRSQSDPPCSTNRPC